MNKKSIILSLFFIFSVSGFTYAASESDSIVAKPSIIQQVGNWYEDHMNYYTITLLMTIESSFIPFPSEVVIPPAAFIASKEDSHLNIYLVVLFGTIGALLGAYINYFLALWLGRPLLHKFADSRVGRMLLLSSAKIQKAEDYFQKHGKTSTFVGRLITVIRQLISIPAGLARMNLITFSIYTFLGAGIWNVILAILGVVLHQQLDIIKKYSHLIGYGILVVAVVAGSIYAYGYFSKRKKT
jgi:membrane protein DedA with SNARE-associated domain